MTIFEVKYVYDECGTPFGIGFFPSRECALVVIDRLSKVSGFRDSPEGFYMLRREIPCEKCPEVVYEALVYYHTKSYEFEDNERVGLFLLRKDAQSALQQFFADNPSKIPNVKIERILNRRVIGRVNFAEGFIKGEWYDTEI